MLLVVPLGGDGLGRLFPIKYDEFQRCYLSLLAATEFLEDGSLNPAFVLYRNACSFHLLYTRDSPVPIECRPIYLQPLEKARTA
jgi:hypothetical protein